jgi:tripartite-type tricarboxylate transporter receptor subunit TctC
MVHIPYRRRRPAFNDLIGGQTDAMFPRPGGGYAPRWGRQIRPLGGNRSADARKYKDGFHAD